MSSPTGDPLRLLASAVKAWCFVARVDAGGSYEVLWSTDPANEGLCGYTPEEMAAQGGLLSTVVPEDRADAEAQMTRVLAGTPDERFLRKRHKDGSIRFVRSAAHPIWSGSEGRVVEIVGAVQDVTEWRFIEQDLRLHADIFGHMQLGLVVWRHDDGASDEFRLVTANAAASRFTSLDLDSLVGASVREVFPPDAAERVAVMLRRRLTHSSGADEEDFPVTQDGAERIFSVRTFALPESCVGITFDDVTERRAMESRLRQAEKMETVGRLAGGLAHDFNNVLTTIVAAASVLEEALLPEDPRRQDVADILDAADRGAALTKRLLTFSRRQPPTTRPLDLDETVEGLQQLLRRLVGNGVQVEIDLCHDLPPVLADTIEVEQVLLNLAVNARQAMGHGGRLTILTRRVEAAGAAWAELSVSDTGEGMDEATGRQIFEPFFTTKGEGTGLGLATVYGIVTHRGGEIGVESAPGQGTTFRVRLPGATA